MKIFFISLLFSLYTYAGQESHGGDPTYFKRIDRNIRQTFNCNKKVPKKLRLDCVMYNEGFLYDEMNFSSCIDYLGTSKEQVDYCMQMFGKITKGTCSNLVKRKIYSNRHLKVSERTQICSQGDQILNGCLYTLLAYNKNEDLSVTEAIKLCTSKANPIQRRCLREKMNMKLPISKVKKECI